MRKSPTKKPNFIRRGNFNHDVAYIKLLTVWRRKLSKVYIKPIPVSVTKNKMLKLFRGTTLCLLRDPCHEHSVAKRTVSFMFQPVGHECTLISASLEVNRTLLAMNDTYTLLSWRASVLDNRRLPTFQSNYLYILNYARWIHKQKNTWRLPFSELNSPSKVVRSFCNVFMQDKQSLTKLNRHLTKYERATIHALTADN
jgi:hypothetical protein